jgi:hypothetical protein
LYCDTCPTILEFSSYNPNYIKIAGDKHPWMLSQEEKIMLENHLSPCPSGGRFRFNAYPRCPFCEHELSTLLPDNIHFLEIGRVIDGDKETKAWKMDNLD